MTKEKRIVGKLSGATIREDGSIELAPMWADELSKMNNSEAALNLLLKQVFEYAHKTQARIQGDRKRFWKRLADDLGLPLDDEPGWSITGRILHPPPKDPPCETVSPK